MDESTLYPGQGDEGLSRRDEDHEFSRAAPSRTARRTADASSVRRLNEQKQRYDALFQQSPDAVVEIDRNGLILRVNPATDTITGYSPGELIGQPFLPFVLLDDRERVQRAFERALCGEPQNVEIAVRHRDGRRVALRVSAVPIVVDGTVVGLWAFAEDVTARRRDEHVARGQARALARMIEALSTAQELDTFLGQVLQSIDEQFRARATGLWFYEPVEDTIALHMICDDGRVLRGDELQQSLTCGPLPAAEVPLWEEVRRRREPFVISDIATEERLRTRAWLMARGVRSVLLVPLMAGTDAIGWITIGVPESRYIRPEEIALALALAQQVTLAVRLMRLAEQNRQGAILAERNRMAREIHDTLAQGFTGIVIQLEAAEDTLREDVEVAENHIRRARNLARISLAEARRSVWALHPSVLEQGDLTTALGNLCRQMTAGSGVNQEFHVYGVPVRLRPEVEANLLRIGMEALTNALKHGQPTAVRIELVFEEEQMSLSVVDNGVGFDTRAAATQGGFGLISMRERAQSIGARLTMRSHPGKGTAVIVEAPARGVPDRKTHASERR